MASKKDPYETTTITVGAIGAPRKRLNKLIAQGWEVVSETGGGLSGVQRVTLRRPNPKFKG